MSTPIANIPVSSGKAEEDPEVAELLNEMNTTATPPPNQREIVKQRHVAPTFIYQEEQKQYFNYGIAQKAIYLVAIAFIIFYPNILNPVYEKFPVFEKFKDNELFIRSAILGMIVYVIMWKFNLS